MGGGILIDPRGRVWPDDSWDVARRIGYKDTRDDITTFAVRERGFVHLRPRVDGMHVALREGRFNLTAFAGLMLELGRLRPPRIMLRVVADDGPKFQLFTDLHDLSTHLEALSQDRPLQTRIPRIAEGRNLRVLNLPTFAAVRPIVQLWESTRGELSDDDYRAILRGSLADRTIVVRQKSPNRLITEYTGIGIKLYRPCEALLNIGRELHDRHDREYGAWIAEAYAETLWSGHIRVASLRAMIRRAAATTLRTHYDRVLVPWRWRGSLLAMAVSIQREAPTEVP
jgi:hypothetical protein